MKGLLDRLERLEAMRPVDAGRLVLLTGPHGPTAEQQAQAAAARHDGREVFTIIIAAPAGRAS